jgi:hypothetical protein
MPDVKVPHLRRVPTRLLAPPRQCATRWVCALLAAAGAASAPVATADPGSPPECSANLIGAMTVLADGKTFGVCEGGAWRTVRSPFNPSDRWLSYGGGVTLHGQGRRNPEILSGQWTGAPLDSSSGCGVEQAPVTDAGVGAPQVTSGRPGQVLGFTVLPVVFTIILTGDCLWTRVP